VSRWRAITLGDFVSLQRGHDLTETQRKPGKVPVMGSAGQNGFHDTALAKGPGIVIGRSGASFGQVHYSPADYWPHNTALYVTDFKGNDPRFAFYFLKAIDFSRYNSGSAQPSLNRNFIYPMAVCVPPLPEQRAIASVLGALDDKIELNRRMNETLEALAQGLFKAWFVDPTQDGLPKGWRESTIGEMCEFAYGKALKEEMRRSGPIPVFGSNGQVGWHDEALVKGPGIVVGRKGNPGIVTWAHTDFFPIDTTFYVVPKGECRSLYFLFYALRAHDLASLGADSAVPGLNRNMAYLSEQVLPPSDLLRAFDRMVKPLFQKIHANDDESRTLAGLRDALLPKLLSGELRTLPHPTSPTGRGEGGIHS